MKNYIHRRYTSIFDSVLEAFSRVVQKMDQNPYLFDVASKLYISTDLNPPVDMQSFELCSDMFDCILDVRGIYGLNHRYYDDDYDDDDNNNNDYENNHANH